MRSRVDGYAGEVRVVLHSALCCCKQRRRAHIAANGASLSNLFCEFPAWCRPRCCNGKHQPECPGLICQEALEGLAVLPRGRGGARGCRAGGRTARCWMSATLGMLVPGNLLPDGFL